jgi:hypothetical protein
MDDNLTDERARAEAYGLWGLVALADAELARRAHADTRADAAPVDRKAPATQTAAPADPAPAPSRRPGRPRARASGADAD